MKRNFALDGLRGCAAFVVIIYHAILGLDATLADRVQAMPLYKITGFYDCLTKFVLAVFNGEVAVFIFFVLSGAVLFESLNNTSQNSFFEKSVDFFIKRVLRIFPALIACLLTFYFLFELLNFYWPQIFQVYTTKALIENALLLNSGMHGATWTLQAEMLAIPFILVTFYLFRLLGNIGLISFFIFSSLATRHHCWLVFSSTILGHSLFYFALGILIPSDIGKKIFLYFKSSSGIFLFFGLVLISAGCSSNSRFGKLAQGVAAFLLVGIIYYHTSGKINEFLQTKFVAYLGKISYSYYLMNVIFLNILIKLMAIFTPALNHYLEFGLLIGVITAVITIPFASLSEKYVEQPFVRLGQRLVRFRTSLVSKSNLSLT